MKEDIRKRALDYVNACKDVKVKEALHDLIRGFPTVQKPRLSLETFKECIYYVMDCEDEAARIWITESIRKPETSGEADFAKGVRLPDFKVVKDSDGWLHAEHVQNEEEKEFDKSIERDVIHNPEHASTVDFHRSGLGYGEKLPQPLDDLIAIAYADLGKERKAVEAANPEQEKLAEKAELAYNKDIKKLAAGLDNEELQEKEAAAIYAKIRKRSKTQS